MLQLQALSKVANSGLFPFRQTFEGQHHLMLLRFNTGSTRYLIAEMKKAANLITYFGQRPVLFQRNVSIISVHNNPSFIYVVLRYKYTEYMPFCQIHLIFV